MALSGVHITFGYGTVGTLNGMSQTTLPSDAVSSQTMAAPATSTIAAPANAGPNNRPLLSISASAAIFYVTGPSPDIVNGPRRYYDPTQTAGREDIFVNPGDKIAWTTA